MPFENASTIPELNPLYPLGADPVGEGDNHIRSLKTALLNFYDNNYQQLFESVYNAAGYPKVLGSFEQGATVTTAKQTVLFEADGVGYSWGGALPKTVPLNSTPSSTGGIGPTAWISRENETFAAALAAVDSDVLVAGVPAKYLALLSRADDYTYIHDGASRMDKLFKSLSQNATSIVITGDSLSFNGFGYDPGMGASGGDYATNNPFGLSSWAHLLRDAVFTSHASFVPIEKCQLDTTSLIGFYADEAGFQKLGINAKAVVLNFQNTGQIANLSTGYPGSRALILSYAPASEAVLFDVNGVPFDNESPTGHYDGYGYFLVPFSGATATISNVRLKIGGGPGALIAYGCGSTNMTIPKLTGKGIWTSGQILAEYSTLVAPYSPNIIYYIIGANDIGFGIPVSTFDADVRAFIDNARADVPSCEIFLMSTPPTTTYSRETAKPYIKAMRQIAIDKNCSLLDMWSLLEDVPPSEYRYDNIHFTTEGDTLVFDIVRKLTFPSYVENVDKFTPSREAFLGAGGGFFYYNSSENKYKPSVVFIQCAASPTVTVKYPSSRNNEFTLTYITINGLTGLEIAAPPGCLIMGVTPLVRSFGSTATRIEVWEVMSPSVWRLIGVNTSNNQVSLASSGLLCMVDTVLLGTL